MTEIVMKWEYVQLRPTSYWGVGGGGKSSEQMVRDKSESLTSWGWRERGIGQRRLHGTNPRSLTSCEVKGEGEFVSTDRLGRIQGYLQAGR